MDEDYLSPEEVAETFRMTKSQLAQLRYHGTGPRYYKPTGRLVLYKRSEVLAWIEASSRSRTDEKASA